jgi:hypothetical protein
LTEIDLRFAMPVLRNAYETGQVQALQRASDGQPGPAEAAGVLPGMRICESEVATG